MQLKTSNIEFKKYGSVYEQPVNLKQTDLISQNWHIPARQVVNQFYHFNCEVCLEIQTGMASLIVSTIPEASQMETFAVHSLVRIHPNTYFSLVAVTPNATCKVIATPSYS